MDNQPPSHALYYEAPIASYQHPSTVIPGYFPLNCYTTLLPAPAHTPVKDQQHQQPQLLQHVTLQQQPVLLQQPPQTGIQLLPHHASTSIMQPDYEHKVFADRKHPHSGVVNLASDKMPLQNKVLLVDQTYNAQQLSLHHQPLVEPQRQYCDSTAIQIQQTVVSDNLLTCRENGENILTGAVNTDDKSKKKFSCEQCDFTTVNEKTLTNHIAKHTGQGLHVCPYCPFTSAYLGTFKRHMIRKHNSKEHGADKSSPDGDKKDRLQCPHCPFVTIYKKNMKKHVAKHTGEGVHRCQYCNYVTAYQAAFHKHQLRHEKEQTFSCPHCEFTTTWKESLEKHLSSKHAEKKTFLCPQCSFVTTNKRSLRQHVQRHEKSANSTKNKYHCSEPGCVYSSDNIQALKQHVASKHVKQDLYQCQQCCYSTNLKGLFKLHASSHPNNTSNNSRITTVDNSGFTSDSGGGSVYQQMYPKSTLSVHSGTQQFLPMHQNNSAHSSSQLIQNGDQSVIFQHYQQANVHFPLQVHIQDSSGINVVPQAYENLVSHQAAYQVVANDGAQHKQAQLLMGSPPSLVNSPSINHSQMPLHGQSMTSNSILPQFGSNLQQPIVSNTYLKSEITDTVATDGTAPQPMDTTNNFFFGSPPKFVNNKSNSKLEQNCDYLQSNYKDNSNNNIQQQLLKCKNCQYAATNKNDLKVHSAVHLNENVLNCSSCDFTTTSKNAMKRHRSKHAHEITYQCEQCDYKTTQKGYFDRHMLAKHSEAGLHSCPHCSYSTPRKSCFKRHLATHQKYRLLRETGSAAPLQYLMMQDCPETGVLHCEHCEYTTDQLPTLRRHLVKHTKQGAHSCLQCSYTTECETTFLKHMSKHFPKHKHDFEKVILGSTGFFKRSKSLKDESSRDRKRKRKKIRVCKDDVCEIIEGTSSKPKQMGKTLVKSSSESVVHVATCVQDYSVSSDINKPGENSSLLLSLPSVVKDAELLSTSEEKKRVTGAAVSEKLIDGKTNSNKSEKISKSKLNRSSTNSNVSVSGNASKRKKNQNCKPLSEDSDNVTGKNSQTLKISDSNIYSTQSTSNILKSAETPTLTYLSNAVPPADTAANIFSNASNLTINSGQHCQTNHVLINGDQRQQALQHQQQLLQQPLSINVNNHLNNIIVSSESDVVNNNGLSVIHAVIPEVNCQHLGVNNLMHPHHAVVSSAVVASLHNGSAFATSNGVLLNSSHANSVNSQLSTPANILNCAHHSSMNTLPVGSAMLSASHNSINGSSATALPSSLVVGGMSSPTPHPAHSGHISHGGHIGGVTMNQYQNNGVVGSLSHAVNSNVMNMTMEHTQHNPAIFRPGLFF